MKKAYTLLKRYISQRNGLYDSLLVAHGTYETFSEAEAAMGRPSLADLRGDYEPKAGYTLTEIRLELFTAKKRIRVRSLGAGTERRDSA
jgi:hypothetical protein